MNEIPGQLPLFTLDACTPETQRAYADEACNCDEVCDECGYHCTSSKECVELAGYQEDGTW